MPESNALQQRGYETLRVVGKGAFGQALLVRHQSSSIAFVAKEIDMTNMSKRDIDGSRNEVAVLAQLDHPNITKFIESFEHNNRIYIVMEYADGGDLAQKIKAQKREVKAPFSEEQILTYFIQICLALKHLHKKQILHRDLKTMNVFLTSCDVVKLGDFGVSKQLGTVGVASTVCGTPYYFSPEMCRNEPYSNKCDVWSLGVLLYELIMLTKPFQAKDIKSLMQVIVKGEYHAMSDKLGHSEELRELCRSLLNLDPQQRPSIPGIMASPYMQRNLKNFARAIREKEAAQQQLAKSTPRPTASPRAAPAPAAAPAGPAPGGMTMQPGKKGMKGMDLKMMMNTPPPGYKDELANQGPAGGAPVASSPKHLREGERVTDMGCRPDFEKTVADCGQMAKLAETPHEAGDDKAVVDKEGAVPNYTPEQLRDILRKQLGDDVLRKCYDAYATFDGQGMDEHELMGRLQQILGQQKMGLIPLIEQYIFREK